MSFQIVHENSTAKILDDETGRIIAVVNPDCFSTARSLVQLANRAIEQAAEEAKKRTENAGTGASS